MTTHRSLHQGPQFSVLSNAQVEKIYQATLQCLERTGVNVHNAEARALLAAAGAQVEGVRVRIPREIIYDAVAASPHGFPLWRRDGLDEPVIGRTLFGPGPSCTYFVDPHTGERREARRGDAGLTALVCDALGNIDYVMGLGLIGDVSPNLAPVYEFAEMVAHTAKPVLAWAYSVDNLSDIYRIALAAASSAEALWQRPFFALFANCHAPLVHPDEELANVLWAIEHDIPVVYLGGGITGLTAPVTGAGLLVVYLAGVLSGLAIAQLKKPGAMICTGGVANAMNLSTARALYGGPELGLYTSAMADIARYLGLPFMSTAGASDAKCLDGQSAIETTLQVLLSGLSGAAMVHDLGFLDCADLGSLESLVMSDEIISMTRRITRGIEVSDETLMLDLIDRVGPGGEFVSTGETARRCRSEIWMSRLMDRQSWAEWEQAGAATLSDRVKARLADILATHQPPPLPDGAARRIEAILQEAEARDRLKRAPVIKVQPAAFDVADFIPVDVPAPDVAPGQHGLVEVSRSKQRLPDTPANAPAPAGLDS